jgi:hypothetical protein
MLCLTGAWQVVWGGVLIDFCIHRSIEERAG